MKRLVVFREKCPQNHNCRSVRECPAGALTQVQTSAPEIDYEKCINCGKCVKRCPKRVFVFEEVE